MPSSLQTSTRHFDTIVIGAGVSGLACAARLFQHQARNAGSGSVKVLEARNRIGGRVGSVYVNGCRLDTGANWIHGIGTDDEPNPLMEILPHKRYRQLAGTVMFRPPQKGSAEPANGGNFAETADDWEIVDIDGRSGKSSETTDFAGTVIPPEPASRLWSTMWSLIGSLHEAAFTTPADQAKNTTLVKAIKQSEAFQSAFKDLDPEYHRTLSALPQFIENMEAAPLIAQSAEYSEEQPGVSLLEYAIDDFDGDQVFLQDGYIAIVDELAKDLVAAGAINLGVEVEQILWDRSPILLETSDGTYEAKTVVCTLPLGVLKGRQMESARASEGDSTGQITSPPLFKPSIPEEKETAISSLGFGTLGKIFLVYSHPWWTEEPYASIFKAGLTNRYPSASPYESLEMEKNPEPDTFLGFTPLLTGLEIHEDGTVHSGLRTLSIINLHALTGFPVLSCFVSCANAQTVEALSNEDAGVLVSNAFRSWIGLDIPKAEAVHVTRWAQDPFSRGSYSNMIAGVSENQHRNTFQQPIRNEHGATLRFAGEHTSTNHFATVHGALLSGWREADEMLGRSN